MVKIYHLLSDNKTVRELSWNEYNKIRIQNPPRKIAIVHPDEVYIFKGSSGIWVKRCQLEQILEKE